MTISLNNHASDQYDNYYWSCLRKVSLNARTISKLDEIMKLTNQSNYTHTINLIVSDYLEILKSEVRSDRKTQQ